jgi:hypothetical protein
LREILRQTCFLHALVKARTGRVDFLLLLLLLLRRRK